MPTATVASYAAELRSGGDGSGGYGDGNAWEREGNVARAYSEPAVVLKRARGRLMATEAKTAVGEEEVAGLAAVAPGLR